MSDLNEQLLEALKDASFALYGHQPGNPKIAKAIADAEAACRAPAAAPAPVAAIPEAVREAIEATFEQRPGYMTKIGVAVRALAAAPAAAPIVQPVGDLSAMGLLTMWRQAELDATDTMPAPFQFAKALLALAAPVVQAEPVAWRIITKLGYGTYRIVDTKEQAEAFAKAGHEVKPICAPATTAAADAKDAALRIIDAHLAEYNESALGYEEAAAFNELESVRADIAAIATSADEVKS